MLSKAFNLIEILIFRLAVDLGLVRYVAAHFCRVIKEHRVAGSDGAKGADAVGILALSPHRFRGDLTVFAAMPSFRVFEVPVVWQTRLADRFYRTKIRPVDLFRPQPGSAIATRQIEFRRFLARLLPRVYTKLGIRCVIGADVRYVADIDWGVASKDLGVPYVVFHRECMLASKSVYGHVFERHSRWGPFPGSRIVVHNEIAKDMFVRSGFAHERQVQVLGNPRMTPFLDRIRNGRFARPARPKVVLFSFYHEQYSRQYPFSVFAGSHVAVARVAARNPGVDVVIKPKREVVDKGKGRWRMHLERAFAEARIDVAALPNLSILPDANAQDLILESTVVVGIDSTTVLEAGIAGREVVVPFFTEIRGPDYADRINYRNELPGAFDVPASGEEMLEIIERKLRSPGVDEARLVRRRALFERYVARMDGNAAELSRGIIIDLIGESQARAAARVPDVVPMPS